MMTDETIMSFGIHKGKRLIDVPPKYVFFIKPQIMFTELKGKETAIMANVIKNGYVDEDGEVVEGKSLEETLNTMELIDDLLVIMKSKSLLNKKQGLKRLLSGRIEMSIKNSTIVCGSSNLQLRDV